MNDQKKEFVELFADARSGTKYAVDLLAAEYLVPNMLKFAKSVLKHNPSPVEDHNDLAQSIVGSMWRQVQEGKHSTMDEDHFFGMFYTIAKRKAVKKLRHHFAAMRDCRLTVGENQGSDGDFSPVSQTAGIASPEFSVNESGDEFQGPESLRVLGEELGSEIFGEFSQLVNGLDPVSHQVLELKMTTDKTQAEIADEIKRSVTLVEGRVRKIKKTLLSLED